MNLDQPIKVLQIVLGEAQVTNACDIVASYADFSISAGTFSWGNQNTLSNGTTVVQIVDAPAQFVQRQVKEVRLFNADTVTHTVTLQLFDGTSAWVIAPSLITVPANGSFIYTPESGATAGGGGSSEWNAGFVSALDPNLSIIGVSLGVSPLPAGSLFGNPAASPARPEALAVGTYLTLTAGGTLDVQLSADHGAAINNGTIEVSNSITLLGTAGGTLTIAPGSGTSTVILDMPAGGGTVDLVAAPRFSGQEWWMSVHQGTTAATINLNAGFVFGATVPTYTPSGAGLIDDILCVSQDGTHAHIEVINKGFTT